MFRRLFALVRGLWQGRSQNQTLPGQLTNQGGQSLGIINEKGPKSSDEPGPQEFIQKFNFSNNLDFEKKIGNKPTKRIKHRRKTAHRSGPSAADISNINKIRRGTIDNFVNLFIQIPAWTLSTMYWEIYRGLTFTLPEKYLHGIMHSSLHSYLGSWIQAYMEDTNSLWRTHYIRIPRACVQANVRGKHVKLLCHLEELEPRNEEPPIPPDEPLIEDPIELPTFRTIYRAPDFDFERPAPSTGQQPPWTQEEERPSTYLQFLAFAPRLLAQHFTWLDAELFQMMIPQECLGSSLCHRDDNGEFRASTVQAVVSQFDQLMKTVITTCLGHLTSTVQDRARTLEHWIHVAQECKKLNNLTSAHAIICGLTCSSIGRLRNTWDLVSRKNCHLFHKLCSEDFESSKRLTMKENISKLSRLFSKSRRRMHRWQKEGVVPFLNPILSELAIIDQKMNDFVEGKRLNNAKMLLENRIMKEIILFQKAAAQYQLEPLNDIDNWFNSIECLNVTDSVELSCRLEPGSPGNNTWAAQVRSVDFHR